MKFLNTCIDTVLILPHFCMAERHNYYLRKGGKTDSVQIPVDIQISDDNEFMNGLLNGQNGNKIQASSSDSSDNELDFNELANSDEEESDTNVTQEPGSSRSDTNSAASASNAMHMSNGSDIQNEINAKNP